MYNLLQRLIAIVMLIILSPLFLIVSILIKLESKGPVFFKQERIGKDNINFMIYKFRSMRTDTPDVATHLLDNPEVFITKVGKFLRKTSLDELPQLINIIKCEMLFVGPRPALYNQYDLRDLRTEKGVHVLYPGVTGWAQVNGRDELEIPDKVEFDRQSVAKKKSEEYIEANCKCDYYMLRLAPVYSDEFKLNIKRRTEIKGFNYIVGRGDNKLSLCNVKNIVTAVKDIADGKVDKNEIYNISDSKEYSFKEILQFNKKSKIKIYIPKLIIRVLYSINNIFIKKQFINENSIKLVSDNIYSNKKIVNKIKLNYTLFENK